MGHQILVIIHVVLALSIIGLVLLQHGKGAEAGAAFGGGASQTLFGSRGATSFLAKLTAICSICFAITSLSMGYISSHQKKKSLLETIKEVQQSSEIPNINDHHEDDEVIAPATSTKAKTKKLTNANKKTNINKETKKQKAATRKQPKNATAVP